MTRSSLWVRRFVAALLIWLLAPAWGSGAQAPEPGPSSGEETLDFKAAVQLALKQSPYLTRSALEIDVHRLNETDSRYALIPPLDFSARYYPNRPNIANLYPRSYALALSSQPYNPFESYYSLQASKLGTQIAILGHLKVITGEIKRLAEMFIQLDVAKKLAATQAEMVEVARRSLAYAQEREGLGEATSLEVQAASQEVQLAEAEAERLAATGNQVQKKLKGFLGLPGDRKVSFNLQQVQSQVQGRFQPAAADLEQARASSYDLKIQARQKELQARNVTVAKTRLLPTMVLGLQSPDPLSLVNTRGYYFSVGFNIPIWDNFKRKREVTRQKIILKQFESEGDVAGLELNSKWQGARERFKSAGRALKLARAEEELAGLKERQGEIRYRSGGEPLTVFLKGRKNKLEARKNNISKTGDYDRAILELRYLSGDLGNSYVDTSAIGNQ